MIGKIDVQSLRDRIKVFDGSRNLRNPQYIRLEFNKNEYSSFAPLNFACELFNMAAKHVDPSLPSVKFRQSIIELDDSVFGKYGNPDE